MARSGWYEPGTLSVPALSPPRGLGTARDRTDLLKALLSDVRACVGTSALGADEAASRFVMLQKNLYTYRRIT